MCVCFGLGGFFGGGGEFWSNFGGERDGRGYFWEGLSGVQWFYGATRLSWCIDILYSVML